MKKKCKEVFLRFIPYGTSIFTGVVIYLIGILLHDDLKGLLINISSAFLSVPLLFLFYELLRTRSHSKLNKEIYNYAKVQMDNEVLSILGGLMKLVYPTDRQDLTIDTLNKFIWMPIEEMRKAMLTSEYLGFQIFKRWDNSENYFKDILKNPFILSKLEDEKILSIISLYKSIRTLESAFSVEKLYIVIGKDESGYIIASNKNTYDDFKSIDRLILLRNIGTGNFQVKDFGDFHFSDNDKLLLKYKINEDLVDYFIQDILNVLTNIIKWLDITGHTIIYDSKQFKMVKKSNTTSNMRF